MQMSGRKQKSLNRKSLPWQPMLHGRFLQKKRNPNWDRYYITGTFTMAEVTVVMILQLNIDSAHNQTADTNSIPYYTQKGGNHQPLKKKKRKH